MKSFKTFIREDKVPDHIGWYPIRQIQDLTIGQRIRSPDGLGEILKIITSKFDKDRIQVRILHPIHPDVDKGKIYQYDFDELTMLGQKLPRKEVKKTLNQVLDSELRRRRNDVTIHPVMGFT